MRFKKIFISLLLVAVMTLGSVSMALASPSVDFSSDVVVDDNGVYTGDGYYVSFSQMIYGPWKNSDDYNKDLAEAFLARDTSVFNKVFIMRYVYDYGETLFIMFSPTGWKFNVRNTAPGQTAYHASFHSTAAGYVIEYFRWYDDDYTINEQVGLYFTSDYDSQIAGSYNEVPDLTLPYCYYSNHTIPYLDSSDVFFQPAPAGITSPAGKLNQIIQEAPLADLTIPILTLVPICLVFLVGYLALRKALAFLRRILQQA